MIENDEWESVDNIDIKRRLPSDWAKIYWIKPIQKLDDSKLMSEYEWAYTFQKIQYIPLNFEKVEKTSQMELRAIELNRDVFMGATDIEKATLKSGYIETEWVKKKLR